MQVTSEPGFYLFALMNIQRVYSMSFNFKY